MHRQFLYQKLDQNHEALVVQQVIQVFQLHYFSISCRLHTCRQVCQQHQIYDVLVEAGATLSTAFLQQGLVDEMISYVAPTLLGQTARPLFSAELNRMAEQFRFQLLDVTQLGQDIRLRLRPTQEMI